MAPAWLHPTNQLVRKPESHSGGERSLSSLLPQTALEEVWAENEWRDGKCPPDWAEGKPNVQTGAFSWSRGGASCIILFVNVTWMTTAAVMQPGELLPCVVGRARLSINALSLRLFWNFGSMPNTWQLTTKQDFGLADSFITEDIFAETSNKPDILLQQGII